MTDKRQVLLGLGWSDDLVDAMLGDFADTPLDVEFDDLPEQAVVSSSELFADASSSSDRNVTALVAKGS